MNNREAGDGDQGNAKGSIWVKTAFGLDLAGYSTGKSGFARADFIDKNLIEVTVYQGHIFARKSKGEDLIEEIVKMEKELLLACCNKGHIFVDIPIHLQGLPCPKNVKFIWELANRPVDFAFDAMPPLADRIGSPVARFLNLFSSLQEELNPLGKQIFETYPACSLNLLGLPSKNYKNSKISLKNMQWISEKSGEVLVKIANGMNLTANEKISLNDDELDAVICAITGIVDEKYRLQGNELTNNINKLIEKRMKRKTQCRYFPPKGYVLLKDIPEEATINITKKIVKSHDEMLQVVAC